MRTLSADDTAKWAARGGLATYLRVDVKDSGGTFRDLTTYPGVNMVNGAKWGESFDTPGCSGTISLKREVEQLSLAPLVAGSPLNLAFAYPGSYSPLITIHREVKIYTASIPTDAAPVSGDWVLMFHGRIDSVDWGKPDGVELAVSDLQGDLRDLFIDKERVYAHADPTDPDATKGLRIWNNGTGLAGMTFAVGDLGLPTDPARNGHFYKVTADAGTGDSGSTEPAWPTGSGSTVVDGDLTWTEKGTTTTSVGTDVETVIQQILNDNGLSAYTLVTPSSPGWKLRWFLQQRSSTWDAVKTLVDQLGWDLRFKFDSGSGDFKPTLWTPDRSKTTADFTFLVVDVFDLTRLVLDIADVRNEVRVIYSSATDLDPTGTPIREFAVSKDPASQTAYGRRFMEIDEASTSNIDTPTEAQAMADNAVADLANPYAEQDAPVHFFPFVELGDLYQFAADAVHYDIAVKLAVTGYQHAVDEAGASTVLTCRGQKPTVGKDRWLGLAPQLGAEGVPHQYATNNTAGVTAQTSDVVGGTRILANVANYSQKALGVGFEFHVSPTNSFAPDASSLLAAGDGNQATAPHLIPGKLYYGRVAVRERNGRQLVRSAFGPQFSFTAGRGSAGHLNDGIALGDYPLNGGFETRLDASDIPDHWSYAFAGGGTFGTNLVVMEDGNGVSGGRYLRFLLGAGSEITTFTGVIPVINDGCEANRYSQLYRLSAWIKNGASNDAGNFVALVQPLDYAGAVGSTIVAITASATTKKGHWQRVEAYIRVDGATSIRSAQIVIEPDVIAGGQTCQIDVDEVRLQCVGTPWYAVGDTSKFTDNYESIPGFLHSWVNFGSSYTPARFRKDQHGIVYLEGLVKSGTIGQSIFVLPVGYRPDSSSWKYFDSAGYQFDIRDDGSVTPQGGANTHVWLGGISFRPDQ